MLCSDGVTRHVTDQEIARLMKHEQRPETICERLKQLCYQGGAEDNLTAIVVDFGPRSYAEEPTKPRIPAKAAKAQVVSKQSGGQSGAQPGAPPRQANRIEVNLKVAQPASNPRRKARANKPEAPGKEGKEKGREAQREAIRRRNGKAPPNFNRDVNLNLRPSFSRELKGSKSRNPRALKQRGDGMPLKGEMSKLMKMSLLFITLVIGVVIGVLLYVYTPLKGTVNNLIGNIDPYEKRRIQYRPTNAEINSAYARHLEGFSDEARTRISAILTANPSNGEALYYLGRIDLDQKKYDDAANRLNQAAKLNADLPDVWAHLAAAYLGLGQPRNAQDALRNLSAPPSSAPGASPQLSPTPAG